MHVVVGSRWWSAAEGSMAPQSCVVVAVSGGVAWCKNERTGAVFAEVAATVERLWTRRVRTLRMPAVQLATVDAA